MATAVTSMRIPTELNERYSRLAKETGRSRSFYVNEALQEAIDRFEYEYGILKDIEDYRAGRLETYSIDEVRAHCGLANLRKSGKQLESERSSRRPESRSKGVDR